MNKARLGVLLKLKIPSQKQSFGWDFMLVHVTLEWDHEVIFVALIT
jgi:hypothetical protein